MWLTVLSAAGASLPGRRRSSRSTRGGTAGCGTAPPGFALLAGDTLDGVPENAALGVSLVEGGSLALLVAVFASNFPEG
jgi:ZIP family zinc transporter